MCKEIRHKMDLIYSDHFFPLAGINIWYGLMPVYSVF